MMVRNMLIKNLFIKKFDEFSNKHNNTRFSRNTALGAVFAETFNRTICNLLKKPFF